MPSRSAHRNSLPRKPLRRRHGAARLPIKSPGRATLELVHLPSGHVQVTVTRWCDKPIMVATVQTMLDSIQNAPEVVVAPFDPAELLRKRHGGGPLPPSDTEKLRIVRGWLRLQGRINQDVYTRGQGISPATLRRWRHQLEVQGKL